MSDAPRPATLPLHPIPEAARQAVLDAAAVLQVRRSEVAARLADGPCPGAEVVAVGREEIAEWMYHEGHGWTDLLSTRREARLVELRISVPVNRYFLDRGVEMVSLFDFGGTEPAARTLLANEKTGNYLFGVCPVQMKIVDRHFVVLAGPVVDGHGSIMKVTTPQCLEAAWRYWEAAIASVVPVESPYGTEALTSRQRQVVGLLAADLGDEAIAAALGVSVRTVRSDVAVILESLGVRSRFAAAARLSFDPRAD